MSESSAIDVDCSELIPECGFECSKCIEEIKDVLVSVEGVTRAHMERRGKEKPLECQSPDWQKKHWKKARRSFTCQAYRALQEFERIERFSQYL